jgi:hypothetical protein
MWSCVGLIRSELSDELDGSILMVERINELETTLAVTSRTNDKEKEL